MNRILYHGTTRENYLQIVQNGFHYDNKFEKTWDCSWEGYVFGYDFHEVAKRVIGYDPIQILKSKDDTTEFEEVENYCIFNAMENARISAAMFNSLSNHIYVLKIEIPGKYVEQDLSCEGMDTASCIEIDDICNGRITNVYEGEYIPGMRFMYLSLLGSFVLVNTSILTEKELDLIESLKNCNLGCDLYDLLSSCEYVPTNTEIILGGNYGKKIAV